MNALRERRRPAVSAHPLAAVPASTCTRQVPREVLGRGRASDVVHVLVDDHTAVLCATRVRHLEVWDGTPLRLCTLCATAIASKHLGPFWKPTRVELAEMHLYLADQQVERLREQLAEIRSAAIADGSALLPVDRIPAYRASRGVPVDESPTPLHAAVILGQLLDRMAPVDAAVQASRRARDVETQQRLTERLTVANGVRLTDLRVARDAKRAKRARG